MHISDSRITRVIPIRAKTPVWACAAASYVNPHFLHLKTVWTSNMIAYRNTQLILPDWLSLFPRVFYGFRNAVVSAKKSVHFNTRTPGSAPPPKFSTATNKRAMRTRVSVPFPPSSPSCGRNINHILTVIDVSLSISVLFSGVRPNETQDIGQMSK